ncbi:MAG: hypothetical protein R3B45_15295 [Bdellovibrionota bacterium]
MKSISLLLIVPIFIITSLASCSSGKVKKRPSSKTSSSSPQNNTDDAEGTNFEVDKSSADNCTDGSSSTDGCSTDGSDTSSSGSGSDDGSEVDCSKLENLLSVPECKPGPNCDKENGFAEINGECQKVDCNTMIEPTPCYFSPGNGIGDYSRSCQNGTWIDDVTSCRLIACTESGYEISSDYSSCSRKSLSLTLSKTANGPSTTIFSAFEEIYFKLDHAYAVPEICIAEELNIDNCSSNGSGWTALTEDGYILSGDTYRSSPWFSRYTVSNGGNFEIFARIGRQDDTLISLKASVRTASAPSLTISNTENGTLQTTVYASKPIYVYGGNLGYKVVANGTDAGFVGSAVCISYEGNKNCSDPANYLDLVEGGDWVYEPTYSGGIGRWSAKLAANTIAPGTYIVRFLNKISNKMSPNTSVTVK